MINLFTVTSVSSENLSRFSSKLTMNAQTGTSKSILINWYVILFMENYRINMNNMFYGGSEGNDGKHAG
jgi:hypothetical protein